jgi:hypothetical protein
LWAVEAFTESEICYFNYAVVQKNIIRFEVAVHNIEFGEALKGFNKLFEIVDSFGLWHDLLGCATIVLHNFLQCPTITILIDEIVIIYGFKHIDILDDVWIIFYFGECTDLIHRTLF